MKHEDEYYNPKELLERMKTFKLVEGAGHRFGTKGTHWYNNGIISVLGPECPEGFVLGRITGITFKPGDVDLWYTNGTDNIRLKEWDEVPAGYYRGRSKFNKKQ